jgi:hypothetical protein
MSKKPKKTNVTTDFDLDNLRLKQDFNKALGILESPDPCPGPQAEDQYIDNHQRNYQRDPLVISLSPRQWKLLETGLETTDLELGDCTYMGIRLRQVEESPGAGKPGNL